VNIDNEIVKAEFIMRENRFRGFVKLNGEAIMVHVPNTGRCEEILIPGITVILRREYGEGRKTQYDLIAAYKGDKLINIDSHIPNKVVEEALKLGKINKLKQFNIIEKEKTFRNSRFDFKLSNDRGNYYLEVKGVTYEEEGHARFPDAPTERGKKHLLELIEAKSMGIGAGVLFLLQMDKMKSFSPFDEKDKAFSDALRLAKEKGVDIFAYECEVTENSISLSNKIDIKL
jgi:sugar fermentation stimulation protein A